LTSTVWIDTFNTRVDGRRKTYRSCQKQDSVIAWPSFHRSPFVRCFVYSKPEVRFMYSSDHAVHFWT